MAKGFQRCAASSEAAQASMRHTFEALSSCTSPSWEVFAPTFISIFHDAFERRSYLAFLLLATSSVRSSAVLQNSAQSNISVILAHPS